MTTPGPEWKKTTLPTSYELRKGDPSAGTAKMMCRNDETKQMGPCTVGLLDFSGKAMDGNLVTFQLSTHLAGGIFRVTYDDAEFVYPMMITGGSLQSDVYYDGECELPCQPYGKLNPTENGSTYDRYTGKSSSKLVSYEKTSNYVKTTVYGAYFSGGGSNPLTFPQPSDVKISKTIRYLGPGTFNYSVTFDFPSPRTGVLFITHAGWVPDASCALMYVYLPKKEDAWYAMKDAFEKFSVSGHHLISPFGMVMSTSDGQRAFGLVPIRAPKQNGVQLKSRLRADIDDEPGWSQNGWKKFNVATLAANDTLDAGSYTWTTRIFFGNLEDVKNNVRQTAMIVNDNNGPNDDASGFYYKE